MTTSYYGRTPTDVSGLDEDARPDLARRLADLFRLGSQVVGVVLLLIGAYYGLQVLVDVLGALRNPANLEPALAGMVQLLGVQDLAIPVQGEKVPVGKPAGVVVLVVWYLVCAWIALAVMSAGGKLATGPFSERRAFFAAVQEFLAAHREQKTNPPAK